MLGEVRVGEGVGQQKGLGKSEMSVCDKEYELVLSGGACDTGLTDRESTHRLSSPILDEKIQMIIETDDEVLTVSAHYFHFFIKYL